MSPNEATPYSLLPQVQAAWNFPLFEAIVGRRSRRFGLGMELSHGPFTYKSDKDPVPLDEAETAMLVAADYRLVFGRGRPLWSPSFNLPTSTAIDSPLISGAVIFGVGWGLAGYCPGPALVSLASGRMEVFVFVIAMVTGMIAVRWMRASPAALRTGLGQS